MFSEDHKDAMDMALFTKPEALKEAYRQALSRRFNAIYGPPTVQRKPQNPLRSLLTPGNPAAEARAIRVMGDALGIQKTLRPRSYD